MHALGGSVTRALKVRKAGRRSSSPLQRIERKTTAGYRTWAIRVFEDVNSPVVPIEVP